MSEDAVLQIQRFNAARDPQRLQLKYLAMRGSPSAFLRGSCHLFYDRLAAAGLLRAAAPRVWVCGDLHLENFGSYRADNGLVHFDISDCDESALAPATCDLLRFLTSVRTGAEGLHIDRRRAEELCRGFVHAYAESLALGKAYWVERDTAQGLVRRLLDRLQRGRRASFLDARTVVKRNRRQLRIDGKKAFPASDEERSAVEDCVREFA